MTKLMIEVDSENVNDGYYTMTELYDNMYAMLAVLTSNNPVASWKTSVNKGWFIVGIQQHPDPIKFHIKEKYYSWFDHVNVDDKWKCECFQEDVVNNLRKAARICGYHDLGFVFMSV